MRGLVQIPSIQDLDSAYQDFFENKPNLVLYSQWARFDPRLAEILTEWISQNWKECDALKLNEELAKQVWPNAIAPLLEFALMLSETKSTPAKSKLFSSWIKLVTTEMLKSKFELYFIGVRSFGSPFIIDDARLSLWPYSKWGYLSREVPINKSKRFSGVWTLLEKNQRLLQLQYLKKINRSFTVNDYIEVCEGWVSRKQAQRDLEIHFKKTGKTRNTRYR